MANCNLGCRETNGVERERTEVKIKARLKGRGARARKGCGEGSGTRRPQDERQNTPPGGLLHRQMDPPSLPPKLLILESGAQPESMHS